jgi:hypothetical protein
MASEITAPAGEDAPPIPPVIDWVNEEWILVRLEDGRVSDVERSPSLTWHAVPDLLIEGQRLARGVERRLIDQLYDRVARRIERDAAPAKPEGTRRFRLLAK